MLSIPRHSLVVSCQAPQTSPLYGTTAMTLMAQAAAVGGAAALRANGPEDVARFRAATTLAVIGIHKRPYGSGVFITPSFDDAAGLVRAGAQLVAIDGTSRPRLDGATLAAQIDRIHRELDVEVMADVDTLEAGLAARAAGADLVATTLSGYTESSAPSAEPDLALVRQLVAALDCPVVAEGRYTTPRPGRRRVRRRCVRRRGGRGDHQPRLHDPEAGGRGRAIPTGRGGARAAHTA